MWVPDKGIYGETIEAKKEGAHLKGPNKVVCKTQSSIQQGRGFNLKFFPVASFGSYPPANKIAVNAVSPGYKKWIPREKCLCSHLHTVFSFTVSIVVLYDTPKSSAVLCFLF